MEWPLLSGSCLQAVSVSPTPLEAAKALGSLMALPSPSADKWGMRSLFVASQEGKMVEHLP